MIMNFHLLQYLFILEHADLISYMYFYIIYDDFKCS